MKISRNDVFDMISLEAKQCKKRLAKNKYSKEVVEFAAGAVKEVLDTSNELTSVKKNLVGNFSEKILPNLQYSRESQVEKILENGGEGNSFATSLASLVHKYVGQEMDQRISTLKMRYSEEALIDKPRKEILEDIRKSLESDELHLELSEEFNDEVKILISTEGSDIIKEVVADIKDNIEDTEKKSEVTKDIIAEYTETKKKIKEQQESLKPKEKGTETFQVFPFLKENVPSTALRFVQSSENVNYNENYFYNLLIKSEEGLDASGKVKSEIIPGIAKRLNFVQQDVPNYSEEGIDVQKMLDGAKECFENAKKVYSDAMEAYKAIGIIGNGKVGFIKDNITLEVCQNLIDMPSDESSRIVEANSIMMQDAKVSNESEFVKAATDLYKLRVFRNEKLSFESYQNAVDSRNEAMVEYLMANSNDRLEKLKNGLSLLGRLSNVVDINNDNLRSTYYKTITEVDPNSLVSTQNAATKCKEMIEEKYETNDFDYLVDKYFQGDKSSNISEENMFEAVLFSTIMSKSDSSLSFESDDFDKIKDIATIFSTYAVTLEAIGLLSKDQKKSFVNDLKRKN